MKYFINFLIILFASSLCTEAQTHQDTGALQIEIPQIKLPVFKTDTLVITAFGAIGDGQTLNHKAINKAIEACSKQGGGVVTIPAGIWLTGPIVLKSKVNLHLEKGALLQFSNDKSLYPLTLSYFEGVKAPRCQNPISGFQLNNIAITGDGVIDGAGDAWRPVKKGKLTEAQWQSLLAKGGFTADNRIWYPSKSAFDAEQLIRNQQLDLTNLEVLQQYKDFFRPQMVSLVACKNVLLDGPTFQNSPAWNIHPLMCEHLTVRNLTVRNPWYSQNGDGIDIESCKIGTVHDCTFDVGDDAICIKSGKDEQGRKLGIPTEKFLIKDCIVYHGHGGFVVGSEMSGGVNDIVVDNCTFIGTDCGLRFKSQRGRGGIVENINISNIHLINIPTDAIRFNLYYGGKSVSEDRDGNIIEDELFEVNEETPVFRNIHFENILCTNVDFGINIRGIPEMPVQNITMNNISISARQGISAVYARDLKINQLKMSVTEPVAIEIQNSKNITVKNSHLEGFERAAVIKGSSTSGISLGFDNLENLKSLVDLQGTPINEIELVE